MPASSRSWRSEPGTETRCGCLRKEATGKSVAGWKESVEVPRKRPLDGPPQPGMWNSGPPKDRKHSTSRRLRTRTIPAIERFRANEERNQPASHTFEPRGTNAGAKVMSEHPVPTSSPPPRLAAKPRSGHIRHRQIRRSDQMLRAATSSIDRNHTHEVVGKRRAPNLPTRKHSGAGYAEAPEWRLTPHHSGPRRILHSNRRNTESDRRKPFPIRPTKSGVSATVPIGTPRRPTVTDETHALDSTV